MKVNTSVDPLARVIQAVPTLYRDVQFRSRLEARWAAFFDQVGWPYEYEPIELAGWIPDFVLRFPHGPIAVEVKPVFQRSEIAPDILQKIAASGWGPEREALLVGVSPWQELDFYDRPFAIGWFTESDYCDIARLFRCGICHQFSLYHTTASWFCRVNGCYDGDGHIADEAVDAFRQAWARAGNITQWKPKR